MSDDASLHVPTVILLLTQVRRVRADELRRVVAAEIGEAAAATVQVINEDPEAMEYITWRDGQTHHNFGTSPNPYIHIFGEGRNEPETGTIKWTKWTMREEVPPEDEVICEAWMQHNAWLYVDALLLGMTEQTREQTRPVALSNMLRIASHFIDERCVLVWRCGGKTKRVALPTVDTLAMLRAGEWPA
jgi:hypothetical protein